MKCKFERDEDCCNSSSTQYMCKCKPEICRSVAPMTNADHIRSMSDEELAFFLAEQWATAARAWQKDSAETLKWLLQTE